MKSCSVRMPLIGIILAALLVGALAACGRDEPPADNRPSDTRAEHTTAPIPADTSTDTIPDSTPGGTPPAAPSDTAQGEESRPPETFFETEPPIDDDYLIDGPETHPEEESNVTVFPPDQPDWPGDNDYVVNIQPTPTPVTPDDGTLSNIEFDRGYTDAGGVVYGRILGALPAGNRITLQMVHNVRELNEFSLHSVADYAAEAASNVVFAAMAAFDETFFETHDLAIVCPGGASGSYRYSASVSEENDRLCIKLTTLMPANGIATMDIVHWAILVPVEKGSVTDGVVVLYSMSPVVNEDLWPEDIELPPPGVKRSEPRLTEERRGKKRHA